MNLKKLFLLIFLIFELNSKENLSLPPDIALGGSSDVSNFEQINENIKEDINVLRSKLKVVGLMQVRNEAPIIEMSLRALAEYTDSIIILDDNSSDNTVAIIKSLSKELRIEKILRNSHSAWFYKTEIDNKQALLDAGRKVGGTHFIQLDADEILTANCKTNNWLINEILKLPKGHVLRLRVIDTWKGLEYYRDDMHISPRKLGFGIIIHDDGICNWYDNQKLYPAGFIHIGRFPVCLNIIDIFDGEHYLIHFKYVNFDFLKIKIAWYMCLERIRLNEKILNKQSIRTVNDINKSYNFYQTCFNDEHIVLRQLKKEWFDYKFFKPEVLFNQHLWRKKEIQFWFKKYGKKYFEELNIWNIGINWNN